MPPPAAGPRAFALVVAFFCLLAAPAGAQTFPKFTGLVVDAANILPPDTEALLTAQLDGLQRNTGRQLVVATIPSLEGYEIADYGYRLLRTWRVGLKDVSNGAILIVAPNDRRVRVEVGYGLEPVLTDAFSSVVVNSQILPAFRDGDMPRGVLAGTTALVDQLSLPDAEARAKVDAAVKAQGRDGGRRDDGPPLAMIFWGIVLLFVLLAMLRGGGGGGGGRRYRRRGGPIILWGPGLGGGWGSGSSGGMFGGGSSGGGGGWMGGGFTGGGGGSAGGGGASGSW